MCEGASKQSPDLKNYTATGPCPPVLKFLDPPLNHILSVIDIIIIIRSLDEVHKTKNNIYVHSGSVEI